MSNRLATTAIRMRRAVLSALFGLCPVAIVLFVFIGSITLRAQNISPALPDPTNSVAPIATNAGALPVADPTETSSSASDLGAVKGVQDAALSNNVIQPLSKAAAEMTSEMQTLKSEGKLTSNRLVAAAVRKVINSNSTQHEIAAPMGAKVIAVHKRPGDLVRVGDKIVTLELNGKQIPVLAKQEGVMQTINVSKGGVIGNSRPRAAQHLPEQGVILMMLRNI